MLSKNHSSPCAHLVLFVTFDCQTEMLGSLSDQNFIFTGTRVCAHREILSVLADPSKDKSIANFPRHDTTALVKAIVLKKEPYTHKKLLKIVAQVSALK